MSRPYESPKRAQQAAATRRKILQALVDLITEERPATISVPQVAKRAGVSVRIVYHHFPNKDALFDGLFENLDELMQRPPAPHERSLATTPEALAAEMPAAYAYLDANRALFRAMKLSEFGPLLEARRQPERADRVDTALADLLADLPTDEGRKVRAVCGLLSSFDGFEALTTTWGLSVRDAGEVAGWAVLTVCAAARARADGATEKPSTDTASKTQGRMTKG